jgi:Fe-S oxidoreductase
VKKIVIGECGHAHKALSAIADRILTGDLAIPRESSITLVRDIVVNSRLCLDPSRNDFPVTLHDPCNMGRIDRERHERRRSRFIEWEWR